MNSEKKKSAMDAAVEEAVKSVDEQLGDVNEPSIDKAFLTHLRDKIEEGKKAGRGFTHADLSESEQIRLRKIAELSTDLTDEELNTLAALGAPEKNRFSNINS